VAPETAGSTPAARDASVTEPDDSGAPRDWAFLGAPDPTLAARLRQQQAQLAPYLQEPSTDGELRVADADVDALLAYAGQLLQRHAGAATKAALESDGQRFLQAAWLTTHATMAAEGRTSVIRIPISACVGWGCEVPSEYVAADCFGPVAFFVTPLGGAMAPCDRCLAEEDDEVRSSCMDTACNVLAEGHFTGVQRGVTASDEPEASEESGAGCGAAWEFDVHQLVPVTETPYDLLLAAGEPAP
jgi:hypothetical protein